MFDLFCRTVKDGEDLDDKAGHHNQRAQGYAEKSKAVLLPVKCHDGESRHQGHDADDHPLIVLFAKRKFIHNYKVVQYNSSKDILRYFLMEKKVLSTATSIPRSSRIASNSINCS